MTGEQDAAGDAGITVEVLRGNPTDEELAAVPEELLKDLLRYSEYGWRDRRIVSLLARCYPVVLTEADVRKLRRLGQKKL